MPLPFPRIVYADKILKEKFAQRPINEQEFYIGSTLPDIRYLAHLDRNITHPEYKQADEFLKKAGKEKDSLELGILLHLYTDARWNEYWLNFFNNDQHVCQKNYYPILFLDCQLLFDYYSRRESVQELFNAGMPGEIKRYSLNREVVQRWQALVRHNLTFRISEQTFREQAKMLELSDNFSDQVIARLNDLKKDKKIINVINNFKDVL